MAGNDNDWKYIPTRRLANMIETAVKKATTQFVNDANDRNLWVKVKSMTENYLTTIWREGALMGNKPNEAFFVKVGLGETMTEQEVMDGKLILQIGIAAQKPAEFTIIKFTQQQIN